MNMNKSTFEKSLVDNLGLEKKVAHNAASIVIDSIMDGIVNHDKLTLVGFGTIDKFLRQPRDGRNPKTGELLKIDAKVSIRFKPGKALKMRINGVKTTIDADQAEVESEEVEAEEEDEDFNDELENEAALEEA